MMKQPMAISKCIEAFQSQGRYSFLYASLAADTGKTPKAIERALSRLRQRGAVANPRKGFYIIVPPEYREFGCLPASWFIDDMMESLDEPYYVGLLSAAELYGAAHHRPQEFQVVTQHSFRAVKCGRTKIRFFSKKYLERTPCKKHNTRTGSMQVSTPEATAFDLVRYAFELGGISAVSVVISDLCESLKGRELVKAANAYELAVVQRLGFILDRLKQEKLSLPLSKWLAVRRPRTILLGSNSPVGTAELNERWHFKVNEEIDLEP